MDNLERPSKAALNFDDENYPEDPSVHFALFKNKYATTDKHPSEVGKIELSKVFLKAMVERANTGHMVVLRVAMWERTSKAGMQYKNFKLELDKPMSTSSTETPKEEDDDDHGLPF
jgi:hypothetical protein